MQPETDRRAFRTLVVPVDESEDSEAALAWVLNHLARPDDKLHLLHIVPEQPGFYSETYRPVSVQERDVKVEHAKGFSVARFLPLLQQQPQVAHELEVVTAGGDANSIGRSICESAQKLHAALLALAPHRKGTIKRILAGSVSDYCLKHCTAPVLIIK